MFEVGWTEMLVIAIVMIVVVGPKDLPQMLRTFGRTAAKLRAMAGDFQKQFNEALKEAELDDVKKSVDALRGLNPMNEVRKSLNPFEKAAADVRSGLDGVMKPRPAADPSTPPASTPQAAEPLKNGATEIPGSPPADMLGVGTPQPLPEAFPAMTDSSVVSPAGEAAIPAEPVKLAAAAIPAALPAAAPAAKSTPAPSKPAKAVAGKTGSAKASAAKPMAATATTAASAKVVPAAKATATKSAAPKNAATKSAVAAPVLAKTAAPSPAKASAAAVTSGAAPKAAAKSSPAAKPATSKSAKPAVLKSPTKANTTPVAAKKKTAGQ